jgi:hypothetical protein
MASDFFGSAVDRTGENGDFHQTDPETKKKSRDSTSPKDEVAIGSQRILMAYRQRRLIF